MKLANMGGGEKMQKVRFGRIILEESMVSSVVRMNGTGNTLHTVVNMSNGTKHDFTEHAQAVWEYFKTDAIDDEAV